MNSKDLFCRELPINSAELKIPRTTYQRELNEDRVRRIAAEFDERIANEPKVSCRDGRYYVFDGQHTIAARKLLNGGRDLPSVNSRICRSMKSCPASATISRSAVSRWMPDYLI